MDSPGVPVQGEIEAGLDRTRAADRRGTYLEVVHSWVVTVDHKKLGILYIAYALIFLVVAGIEAMCIRIQLSVPHNNFVSALRPTIGCSRCTAPPWCSSSACRCCSDSATTLSH